MILLLTGEQDSLPGCVCVYECPIILNKDLVQKQQSVIKVFITLAPNKGLEGSVGRASVRKTLEVEVKK